MTDATCRHCRHHNRARNHYPRPCCNCGHVPSVRRASLVTFEEIRDGCRRAGIASDAELDRLIGPSCVKPGVTVA